VTADTFDEGPLQVRRLGRAELTWGFIITLGLHGLLVGVVLYERHHVTAPTNTLLIPSTPVVATLARLGKPRDLSFLPHKAPAPSTPKTHAPTGTQNENAAPSKHLPDPKAQQAAQAKAQAQQQQQNLQSAADLARQLAAAPSDNFTTAEVPQYGDPNGSAFGNSDHGTKDAWLAALLQAMNWNVPATIPDSVAQSLQCQVNIKIEGNVLTDYSFVTRSGNPIFDQNVQLLLDQAKQRGTTLPDTPAEYKAAAEAGQLEITFTGRKS
jgi:hypothetical protein